MSSRDREPEGQATDLSGRQERGGVFGVPSGNASPAFKVENGVFNQVAQLVEVLVIVTLNHAMSAGRDDGDDVLTGAVIEQGVGVVATIGKEVVSVYAFDEGGGLCAISDGTRCNSDSERHTMRIHGQMYLGVEPPFVRPMA